MGDTVSKDRLLLFLSGRYVEGAPGVVLQNKPYSISGKQNTISHENGGRPKDASYDVGSAFWTSKQTYSGDSKQWNLYGTAGRYYSGPLLAKGFASPSSGYPSAGEYTDAALWAMGTTAIARTLPTHPVSSLAVALGELQRDGIPDTIGQGLLYNELKNHRNMALSRRRAIGGEYLNVEFGWKPLINDLMSFAHVVKESKKILKQYERDSGSNIRRRYDFPVELSSNTTVEGVGQYPYPPIYSSFYPTGGSQRTRTITTSKRTWFSGCYTYHLTTGTSARDKVYRAAEEANKLYGTRLTPEVVWNLAPWSWAADWVTNIGDVMTNVSAFQQDGLVMRYGYVMSESRADTTYDLAPLDIRSVGRVGFTQTFTNIVKKRVKATPYGFGLDTGGFTTRQWAILGALGLSRAPGKMR